MPCFPFQRYIPTLQLCAGQGMCLFFCYISADLWYNNYIMKGLYRNITEGIRNLIYWFPIIWQDRDFDYYYLSAILRHKMKSMAEFYDSSHAWGIDAPKLAHEMKFCVLLLDRIVKDDYNREGYDEHDKKWGELEFITDESVPGGALTIGRKNRNNMNEKLEQKEYKRVYEDEIKYRDVDIATLFEIMKKNLLTWWD